jgi:hypothetical protein
VSKFDAFTLGAAVGCIGIALVAGLWAEPRAIARTTAEIRAEAIKAGAAEYVIVDPATGRTEFRWKEQRDV